MWDMSDQVVKAEQWMKRSPNQATVDDKEFEVIDRSAQDGQSNNGNINSTRNIKARLFPVLDGS